MPVLTIENTRPDFFWLTNYLETALSAAIWQPSTSATSAWRLRALLEARAEATGADPEAVGFQGHDFSFRGMPGIEAAAASGAAHLLSFSGSDSLVSADWIDYFYPDDSGERILGSVAATEHSVMCAGTRESEDDTYRRLLDLYPSGVVSVVSDTFDLWRVLTETLPALRDRILARDGTLVIRPDSGDPETILCGTGADDTPAGRGVVALLWETFGGTVNAAGYRVLDPRIGVIYGDSITYDRADAITARLKAMGFVSTTVVFGVGSYTYQYVTRDTFSSAMKATYVEVDGIGRDIFKAPVTDSGTKRSARGRLAVLPGADGELVVHEQATPSRRRRARWSRCGVTEPSSAERVSPRSGRGCARRASASGDRDLGCPGPIAGHPTVTNAAQPAKCRLHSPRKCSLVTLPGGISTRQNDFGGASRVTSSAARTTAGWVTATVEAPCEAISAIQYLIRAMTSVTDSPP